MGEDVLLRKICCNFKMNQMLDKPKIIKASSVVLPRPHVVDLSFIVIFMQKPQSVMR